MNYGFFATIKGLFDDAVQRVVDSLKAEGFGVLSDIDIQKAMKDKLGKDMRRIASSARAIPRSHTRRSRPKPTSDCCCRATSP